MELIMVNSMGLPFTAAIPTLLIIGAVIFLVCVMPTKAQPRFAAADRRRHVGDHRVFYDQVIVVRANADPPINMNNPNDATASFPTSAASNTGVRCCVVLRCEYIQSETRDRYGRWATTMRS